MTATASELPKRGIDYSKFDNIEDSDDEKPAKTSTPAVSKPVTDEKIHCANCHKDVQKPLRCGVCKKVSYCSAQCQREDWQFHKRTCRKPEETKKETNGNSKKPAPSPEAKERREQKKQEEKIVDNDDDVGTWYRHREWRPSEEPKKEFRPVQLDASATSEVSSSASKAAGSAWNAAGTWEDKDTTAMAQKTLRECLEGIPDVEAAGGVLSAAGIENVEGEASKPVIRGKLRHMFDLSFKLKFIFKWMDSEGQQKADGILTISDFTNDTFAESVLAAPVVELSFKEGRRLEASRRQAVEASVGSASWPPAAGSLLEKASTCMKEFVNKYEQVA